jgi:hypothetical protein
LVQVLAELRLPRWPHPLLPAGDVRLLALPPPERSQIGVWARHTGAG